MESATMESAMNDAELEKLTAYDLVASMNGLACVVPDNDFKREALNDDLSNEYGDLSDSQLRRFSDYAKDETAKSLKEAGYDNIDPSSWAVDEDSMSDSYSEHDPICVLRASGDKVVASVLARSPEDAEMVIGRLPAESFPDIPVQGPLGKSLFSADDFSCEALECNDQSLEHKKEILGRQRDLPKGAQEELFRLARLGHPSFLPGKDWSIDPQDMDFRQRLSFCFHAVDSMTGGELAEAVNEYAAGSKYSQEPICEWKSGKMLDKSPDPFFGKEGGERLHSLPDAKKTVQAWIGSSYYLDDPDEFLEDFAGCCIKAMGMEKSASVCGRLNFQPWIPERAGASMPGGGDWKHFYMLCNDWSDGFDKSWGALANLRNSGLAQFFTLKGGSAGMYKVDPAALVKEPALFKSGGFDFFKSVEDARNNRGAP